MRGSGKMANEKERKWNLLGILKLWSLD